jgi:hypothetical protein
VPTPFNVNRRIKGKRNAQTGVNLIVLDQINRRSGFDVDKVKTDVQKVFYVDVNAAKRRDRNPGRRNDNQA